MNPEGPPLAPLTMAIAVTGLPASEPAMRVLALMFDNGDPWTCALHPKQDDVRKAGDEGTLKLRVGRIRRAALWMLGDLYASRTFIRGGALVHCTEGDPPSASAAGGSPAVRWQNESL